MGMEERPQEGAQMCVCVFAAIPCLQQLHLCMWVTRSACPMPLSLTCAEAAGGILAGQVRPQARSRQQGDVVGALQSPTAQHRDTQVPWEVDSSRLQIDFLGRWKGGERTPFQLMPLLLPLLLPLLMLILQAVSGGLLLQLPSALHKLSACLPVCLPACLSACLLASLLAAPCAPPPCAPPPCAMAGGAERGRPLGL